MREQINMQTDTICAIATSGGGAIGIIRVSGQKAINIVSEIVDKPILQIKGGRIVFRRVIFNSQLIDEVLISVFKAPHSYTGEDSVEISCHASSYIMQQILKILIMKGGRMANPGEFTQRAFLNGKMDLAEAEAVADLIASKSKVAHDMAISQMRGAFSDSLRNLRDRLLHITSLLELELDFSDQDDIAFANREELIDLLNNINDTIKKLTDSFALGNAIKTGVPIAIVGNTNVGKSTLLNCLLKEEKAIVSSIHGTTRDTIDDVITLGNIDFRFIDTAGIRKTNDEVEKIGIDRSKKAINKAATLIWVIDNVEQIHENGEIFSYLKNSNSNIPIIIAINKIDINPLSNDDKLELQKEITNLFERNRKILIIPISAAKKEGIINLEENLISLFEQEINEVETPIVSNIRHYNALIESLKFSNKALTGLKNNLSSELVSEELRGCITTLSEIIGEISSQNILNNIFKNFCIGK